MIMAIASDHGGYDLKLKVAEHLKERGYQVVDLGTDNKESVDYPVFGKACAEAVVSGKADLGMIFCGTGIGISIAANKVKGARCALCTSEEMAALAKQHNNANILSLGGRILTPEQAIAITDAWLDAEFEGGRHQRRIDMLNEM
jgi:ribose 5-phosphate isomerase B